MRIDGWLHYWKGCSQKSEQWAQMSESSVQLCEEGWCIYFKAHFGLFAYVYHLQKQFCRPSVQKSKSLDPSQRATIGNNGRQWHMWLMIGQTTAKCYMCVLRVPVTWFFFFKFQHEIPVTCVTWDLWTNNLTHVTHVTCVTCVTCVLSIRKLHVTHVTHVTWHTWHAWHTNFGFIGPMWPTWHVWHAWHANWVSVE